MSSNMDVVLTGDEKQQRQHFRRGLWSPDEDELLLQCIAEGGITRWSDVPIRAGLRRSGKSCRLRWINYLRPELNHNRFSPEEDKLIIEMHRILGNRWSKMAARLRGRTDNQIKNHWNSTIKKKFRALGFDPETHKPVYPKQQNAVELEAAPEAAAKASELTDTRSSSLHTLGSNNPQYDIMAQGASSIFTMQQTSAYNFSGNLPEDFVGDCIYPAIFPSEIQPDQAQQWMPMVATTPSNLRSSESCGLLPEFWEGLSH